MQRQDAIDRFNELNSNGTIRLLVRMKIKSLLASCQTITRTQDLENYSDVVKNIEDFLLLINDPDIVTITSIIIPTKTQIKNPN